MRRLLAMLLVVMVLSAPRDAPAAACSFGQSPFDDVPDSAIFCKEALWLRNALVTLGCGDGSNYCPADSVTRGQMALFMNRLAVALTPDVHVAHDQTGFQGDLDTGGVTTCVSGPYTIPPNQNGRYLSSLMASLAVQTAGAADLSVLSEMNVNGGAFTSVFGSPQFVHAESNQWTNVTLLASSGVIGALGQALAPGATYSWRVRITRLPGTVTTGEIFNTRCQVKVDLPINPVTP
jgi:hypothetical protein